MVRENKLEEEVIIQNEKVEWESNVIEEEFYWKVLKVGDWISCVGVLNCRVENVLEPEDNDGKRGLHTTYVKHDFKFDMPIKVLRENGISYGYNEEQERYFINFPNGCHIIYPEAQEETMKMDYAKLLKIIRQ